MSFASTLFALIAYAVPVGAAEPARLTLTVESTSSEGTWSCLVDLWVDAKVERAANGDKITVTVHEPHARMEAAASAPAAFRATIAAESPGQQAAIAQLDGASATFVVDRKTGALRGTPPRFPVDVRFAGVDAAYWFALAWVVPLPQRSERHTATYATAWGVPWQLAGDVTVEPSSYFAPTGSLTGELTVGQGTRAIRRKLTLTRAPRR